MDAEKIPTAWRAEELSPWLKGAALLVPVWMMALAVSAEGFPHPPVSAYLGFALFFGAIAAAILMVKEHWAGIEYLLVCFAPLLWLASLDEISTTYKTPFIFFCTQILCLGVIAYHILGERHYPSVATVLVLLTAAALAMLSARHASSNFWAYQDFLDVGMCFLDFPGCPALPSAHPAWWTFFFSF